jgi:choline-glycine betaine transporter
MDWDKVKTWIFQHLETLIIIIGLPLLLVLLAYLSKIQKATQIAQTEVKTENVKGS